MKTKQQKVVGYVRVSTHVQALDGESLERQEEQIRAFCARKGIQKADLQIIADNGMSGFKSSRPGFKKLTQLCLSKQVRMVVVYDLSRLSRSVRDTLAFVEDVMQKHGIEFVSLQNDIDTSTPMGKAFLTFNAMFNQLYRDEIAFKTKAALTHKRRKGEKTGGVVPFGYSLVEGTRLIPAAGEQKTVARIHKLRRQGLSLREIVADLERKGIPTKTGKSKWKPQVVLDILSRQIEQIANNPGIPDREKDALLEDVAGALYDTKDLSRNKKQGHERLNQQQKAAVRGPLQWG